MPRFSAFTFPVAFLLAAACGPSPDGFIVYDTPPAVSIVEPVEGALYNEGEPIVFRGLVSDNSGVENLQVQWASSIDDILLDTDTPDANGAVELATASLSPGSHVITLRAFDPGAQQGEARVNVVIEGVPEAPSITIERPQTGETGLENEAYRFMVTVGDAQDAASDLTVELSSDPEGFLCSMVPDVTGLAYCEEILDLGEHVLTFTVTDTEGNQNHANVVFSMVSLLDFDGDHDGWTPNQGDCDDNNNTIHPGATELCDGLDNDCSSITPIDSGTICYDDDGDDYCEAPPCVNASGVQPDCNDAAPGVHPNAGETPNGVDDDCNGLIDDGLSNYDDDGDGYCETPPCVNATSMEQDCDDSLYLVNPGQTEICGDGLDNNCNLNQNERDATGCTRFYVDQDEDGYGVNGNSECWCEAGGAAYPYGAPNTSDCYDTNALVHPNQTQFFSIHRGDGSYDYDCNYAQEKQWRGTAVCSVGTFAGFSCNESAGWTGSEPSCGSTGAWSTDCNAQEIQGVLCLFVCYVLNDYASCLQCFQDHCTPNAQSRLQGCR